MGATSGPGPAFSMVMVRKNPRQKKNGKRKGSDCVGKRIPQVPRDPNQILAGTSDLYFVAGAEKLAGPRGVRLARRMESTHDVEAGRLYSLDKTSLSCY